MVHGILRPRVKPPLGSLDDWAAVGSGTILGSWSELSDLGFVGNKSDRVNVSDSVTADVTRAPTKPKQKWDIFPDRRVDEKDVDDLIVHVDPFGEPADSYDVDNPPFSPSSLFDTELGEALEAKDKIDYSVNLGTNEPFIIKNPPYQAEIDIAVSRFRQDGRNRYISNGKVLSPCKVLKNENFDIEKRRHVRTGKSGARLRQIRRTYAYVNCK